MAASLAGQIYSPDAVGRKAGEPLHVVMVLDKSVATQALGAVEEVMRILLGLSFGLVAVAGCGGDGGGTDPVENQGFVLPTASTKANVNNGNSASAVWAEVGPADWSCLGTPAADVPSTVAITLSGQVQDFQTDAPVPSAAVTVFNGIEHTAPFTNFMTDLSGNYAGVTLPAGTTRIGYKVVVDDYLDTFLLNQYYEPGNAAQTENIAAISEPLAIALPALINLDRTEGTGVIAGTIRDCQRREVSHAIATVSTVPSVVDHLPEADTYYFTAGGSSLPTTRVVPATNKDGLFVVFELVPQTAPAYVQVWGFVNDADVAMGEAGLTLLSELTAPVLAETVVTGSFEPLRTN